MMAGNRVSQIVHEALQQGGSADTALYWAMKYLHPKLTHKQWEGVRARWLGAYRFLNTYMVREWASDFMDKESIS